MCHQIDDDIDRFEIAVGELEGGPREWKRETDPGYGLRNAVCEKSRFVWLSAREAGRDYEGVLENRGSTRGTRASRIDSLFKRAIELLSGQDDLFLRNVRQRYESLQAVLTEALARPAPNSSPSGLG